MLKLTVYTVATLASLAGAALAEPMKLTVNQAFSVSVGIDQLNKGATQIIKDGAKETQAQTPFAFGPGFRVALAVNASHISDAIGPAQRALKAARDKLASGGGELDAEARKAIDAEAEKIGAQILEIDLAPITEDQLALDKNPGISAATIQALLPIFKRPNTCHHLRKRPARCGNAARRAVSVSSRHVSGCVTAGRCMAVSTYI